MISSRRLWKDPWEFNDGLRVGEGMHIEKYMSKEDEEVHILS